MDVDSLENAAILVRTLKAADLERLVRMDQAWGGKNRSGYLQGKLDRALRADVRISLGAEIDGTLVGAVLGSVQYGEFGQAVPVAILDTLLVDRKSVRKGIGRALFRQMMKNLAGLHIERVRTEVGWNEQQLIAFLAAEGFSPVPRLVLEREIG